MRRDCEQGGSQIRRKPGGTRSAVRTSCCDNQTSSLLQIGAMGYHQVLFCVTVVLLLQNIFYKEAAGSIQSEHRTENCVTSPERLLVCGSSKRNGSLSEQHSFITAYYNKKKIVKMFKDSSIDTLVDFIIDAVRHELMKKGHDEISIPDVHETFHKRIGPIKVKGSFDANKGWFKSLASLYRTEEITVSRNANILTVTVGVGLRTMVMGYDNYKAKFEHIGPTGKIKGEVDQNSIEVKLSVDINGSHCKVSLSGLKFKEFSKLKIHLTGLGKLSWIFSKVVTWITNMFKNRIIHSAEKELSDNLEVVLNRIQCYSRNINAV